MRNGIFFLCLSLFTLLQPAHAELSARAIMQQVDDRDDGDNGISDLTMTLIDRNGDKRIRRIRRFIQDKAEYRQRIMFFIEPADVKDTGFLTYDYDKFGKDDDQWLYLPALRKSKRIAANAKSGAFMGSDFNYADMTRKNLDSYKFSILKELTVRGAITWMIEAIPRTRAEIDNTGYKKSWIIVRKDNFVVVRAVHWTAAGGRMKYYDVSELQVIDGIWVATKTTMTTKRGKVTLHRTVLDLDNVRFDQNLNSSMFTVRRLEKGL